MVKILIKGLFFLGLDNLTSSLGLMFMLQGIGSIIGAPMVGAIYNAVGSFDTGFYIAGGFFVMASFCSFAAQALQRRKKLQSTCKNENNPFSDPITLVKYYHITE